MSGQLKKSLGPLTIWGLGVGYVISGMYFGWNLGLPEGGPFGFFVATLIVTLMYVTFVLSYAELACAIPRAGGAFVYATQSLNPNWGLLAGTAQCIEFIFAPPAIAAAIGAYFNIFFPGISATAIAVVAYLIFTGLNIYGVKHSALFELLVTFLAVLELLLFTGVTLPHFHWLHFSSNPLPKGWIGVLPALPYAIWFYLGIEGLANVAEEALNPHRDLAKGFAAAMATLVILAVLVFFASTGVSGWEKIVYAEGTSTPSDSPLPLALGQIVGKGHFYYHLLISIGLCGLIASFHGILLVAGRATFEMGRMGYAPKWVGTVLPTRNTPAAALLLNMTFGFAALLSGRTGEIITLSVFGALTMYVISLLSLFQLRRRFPDLRRPFSTPMYPWFPGIALALSLLCLTTMAYYNARIGLIYLGIIFISYGYFVARNLRTTRSQGSYEESTQDV